MITEKDLQEAIAECRGQRNPNAGTCIKLAAFLTIQRELFGTEPAGETYSRVLEQAENTIDYRSDTEFSRAIYGKNPGSVWKVMDELMTTLQAVYPRLYDSVLMEIG